jgi:hypothetical protein
MVAKANVLGPSRKWRPMTLLDEVIEAGGGMARWNSLKRFTLQLSIDGALFSRVGQAGRFREMVAEGSTRNPSVRFTGFADPAKCGLYQPDCVTIESPEGKVLRAWRNPHQAFRDQPAEALWDELYLVFFCGFSVWNYLTTPFLLAHPDIAVEELAPWHEHDQLWRRLRAVFPANFVTHCAEQIFYFDENGLQRRNDHDLLGSRVAQYSWAHQDFLGIVVPTLRRSLSLQPDGTVIAKPALIDVEIFDAAFE